MKISVMLICLGLSIFLGVWGGYEKSKPNWWKLVLVLWLGLAIVLTFIPPLAGTYADAKLFPDSEEFSKSQIYCSITSKQEFDDYYEFNIESKKTFTLSKANDSLPNVNSVLYVKKSDFNNSLESKQNLVLSVRYNKQFDRFDYLGTVSVAPLLTYPYIHALKERIRNLNFHVPMHWISLISFFIGMIFSIRYLRNPDPKNDIKAYSAILVGLLFAFMGTTTGMIWAKFNWGSFWNWDPRQVTIFIIIMLYFAYFALRSAIEYPDKKAKLSAVYAIICFATAPFFYFVIPRMYSSLHPGAKNEDGVGPVIDTQADMLDSSLALTFYLSLGALILLFFWIYNITVRYQILQNKLKEAENV